VDSTGGSNTLRRMEECSHEAATSNLLYGQSQGAHVRPILIRKQRNTDELAKHVQIPASLSIGDALQKSQTAEHALSAFPPSRARRRTGVRKFRRMVTARTLDAVLLRRAAGAPVHAHRTRLAAVHPPASLPAPGKSKAKVA